MNKSSRLLKSKLLSITSISIFSLTISSIVANHLIIKNKNYSNINTLEQKSYNNQQKITTLNNRFISGNVTPNNFGELVLPSGKQIQVSNAYEMQKISPVPGGWVVPTQPIANDTNNNGESLSFINQNDNTIKWTSNYAARQNSKIITTQYDKTTNKIIVLRCIDNYSLYVFALDPNDGRVVSEKLVYQGHDQNWILNQKFDMVEVVGVNSKWIMLARGMMTSAERFDSRSKIISFNGSSFTIESLPNVMWNYRNENFVVLSYGAYYNKVLDKIELVLANWFHYEKTADFMKMTIGQDRKIPSALMFNSDGQVFSDSNKISEICSRLNIQPDGDTGDRFTVTFLYNNTYWAEDADLGFYNEYIISNYNTNKFVDRWSHWVDINGSGSPMNSINVDISNPYLYNGKYYGIATYLKNERSGEIISRNAPYIAGGIRITSKWNDNSSSDFNNWDKNNPESTENSIKVFTKGIKKIVNDNKYSHYIIPSYDGNFWGSFQFGSAYYAIASALSESNYSIINEKLGRYAYWTRGTDLNGNGEILITKKRNYEQYQIDLPLGNMMNKSAFDCSYDLIRSFILNNIIQKTTTFNVDKNWKVDPTAIQDQDTTLPQGTKWSYYFYKGIAPFSVHFTNVFIEGCYIDDLNAYIMASGFKQWTTSLKDGVTIDASYVGIGDISPSDLVNNYKNSKEAVAIYLKQNLNKFWYDLPKEFDFNPNSDLTIEIINPNDRNRSADVIVHTKKWINEKHELQVGDKTWTIKINNLRNPFISPTWMPSIIKVNDVKNVDPNQVNLFNEQDINLIKIKEAIKNSITDPYRPINNTDIQLEKVDVDENNGVLFVNVILNNSIYQNNGTIEQTHKFNNISLTGFKAINLNPNLTTLAKTVIKPKELGISEWVFDFEPKAVETTLIEYINNRIFEFFNSPLPDYTKVSSVSFTGIDNAGNITTSINFIGNNNGAVDKNMNATLSIIELKQKPEITKILNNAIEPMINREILNDNNSSEENILFRIKQNIANTTNTLRQQLPNKLFDPNDLTANDIYLTGNYAQGKLEIINNQINRLGGIELCTGIFPKDENEFDNNAFEERIWVVLVSIAGGIMLFIIILALILVIKKRKENRIESI